MTALATLPDLLRLVAVPVLGWAAVQDVRTRRVPNRTWTPLALLALGLLAVETWNVFTGATPEFRRTLFVVHLGVSLGVVAPIAYLFWRFGGFGGADAKAIMVLAALFPEFPAYAVPLLDGSLPLVEPPLGVFSLTVLTNAVLAGALYPVALTVRNLAAGRRTVAAAVGLPIHWTAVETTHGRLLETGTGLTRRGLDLDALRMYLRWRGLTLADLREEPAFRDPETLPEDPGDPTDGAVLVDGGAPGADPATEAASETDTDADGDGVPGAEGDPATEADASAPADAVAGTDPLRDPDPADPWGAAAFLAAIEGSAYGTSPEQLREGLDLLVDREEVWVSPGIPFLVPVFLGLLVGLVAGDVLFALLGAL